jgi:hypothetical protein
LTTVLAHSSGEWVSSDWPVCPVGETAAPHKMGAALTYARRYALFTLVGIAGEDDLDAPDLPGVKLAGGTAGPCNPEKPDVDAEATNSTPPYRKGLPRKRSSVPTLDAGASAAMRDRLAAEIAGLGSVDVAIEWARRGIVTKNTLTAEDAGAVETAFRDRMHIVGCCQTYLQRIRRLIRQPKHRQLDQGQSKILLWKRDHMPPCGILNNRTRDRREGSRPRMSTRAPSRLASLDATETRSIFDLSPKRPVSFVGENPPIPIILASCSRARSAER